MSEKLKKLKALMKKNNVDLLGLGPGTHMKWLLGFNPYPDERPCMLIICLLYTSPSPRDVEESRMPSSA